jgi:hypothetical protein
MRLAPAIHKPMMALATVDISAVSPYNHHISLILHPSTIDLSYSLMIILLEHMMIIIVVLVVLE